MGLLDFIGRQGEAAKTALFGGSVPVDGGAFRADMSGVSQDDPIARQLGTTAELRRAPVMEKRPGLLHKAWDYIKSPEGLTALSAGISGWEGDDAGVDRAFALQRQMKADKERLAERQLANQNRERLSRAMKGAYTDDGSGRRRFDQARYWELAADADPVEAAAIFKTLSGGRRILSNAHGFYRADDDAGEVEPIREFGPTPPSGWELDEESGGLRPIKNGPYDPDYIARTAGARREAVVSRPMPVRTRPSSGGGRGGSIPPPPPGPGIARIIR